MTVALNKKSSCRVEVLHLDRSRVPRVCILLALSTLALVALTALRRDEKMVVTSDGAFLNRTRTVGTKASRPSPQQQQEHQQVNQEQHEEHQQQQLDFRGVIARAFDEWQHEFPCYPPPPDAKLLDRAWNDRSKSDQGLLYEKPPKCASTTVAGVNMRVARNVAKRINLEVDPESLVNNNNNRLCDMRWSHGQRFKGQRYQNRIHDRSFLWSVIREPTKRYISWFYFMGVTLSRRDDSDASFQAFLRQQKDHFYLDYLNTRPFNVRSWNDAAKELNFVMNEYNYIGITERLEESLVVLMLLLKLPMSDILYYSSKQHDGLFARGPGTPCFYLHPSHVSEGMREFLETNEWKAKIQSDLILYQAVNRSLDLTIDKLGRDKVEAEIKRFRAAQALVKERCQGKSVLPCDKEGELARPVSETGCLVGDVGCGMECLDSVADELKLWQ